MSLNEFIANTVASIGEAGGTGFVEFDIPFLNGEPALDGANDTGLTRVRFKVLIPTAKPKPALAAPIIHGSAS